jgi:regulatory protein YycI of two-component signal transduction system YycFG
MEWETALLILLAYILVVILVVLFVNWQTKRKIHRESGIEKFRVIHKNELNRAS